MLKKTPYHIISEQKSTPIPVAHPYTDTYRKLHPPPHPHTPQAYLTVWIVRRQFMKTMCSFSIYSDETPLSPEFEQERSELSTFFAALIHRAEAIAALQFCEYWDISVWFEILLTQGFRTVLCSLRLEFRAFWKSNYWVSIHKSHIMKKIDVSFMYTRKIVILNFSPGWVLAQ